MNFGHERMLAELDAYRCLKKALWDACKMKKARREGMPSIFKPFKDAIGFFPALGPDSSGELLWVCYRLAFSSGPYIEFLRFKQAMKGLETAEKKY